MTSLEISKWMAYRELYPFGSEINVFMMAQLTALLAQVNGVKNKTSDYIPVLSPHKQSTSIADKIKAIFS